MKAKSVGIIILWAIILILCFSFFEARKVRWQVNINTERISSYREGYNAGFEDGRNGAAFDPEVSYNDVYEYDMYGNHYTEPYSKAGPYSAAFVAGYGSGYYDGQKGDDHEHEDGAYEWKYEEYNRFFYDLSFFYKIR